MDILAHIIAYLIFAALILSGLGIIVAIVKYFYYRQWRSDSVRVYYDDNDHRKGYYTVKRPRGPYPIRYPKEQIRKDMENFERLKREEKEKARNKGHLRAKYDYPFEIPKDNCTYNFTPASRKLPPEWIQILRMTPAEYMVYRRRKKALKRNHTNSKR